MLSSSLSMTVVTFLMLLSDIFAIIPALYAESITVNGTVTEEGTGIPVSGASVTIVSETADTVSTVTGLDGKYSLAVDILPVSVNDASRPETFMLNQNYPNPFNPSTTIEFLLNRPGQAQLSIYNIMGQKIRQLTDGYHEEGLYRVVWDGADEYGRGVSAGVYLYRLTTGGQSLFRKMLLLDGGGKRSAVPSYPATVLSGRGVKKQAGSSRYTLSVKREGYVTFENYKFMIPSSGETDITLQKKSGATL